jgi:hypothetical protein
MLETMTKADVVQRAIDKIGGRTYLEIGVWQGVSFMPIRTQRKIAVDQKFAITRKSRLKWLLKNFANIRAEYHECTSDAYFDRKNPADRFDVVLVDGLHTFEQSRRDVLNSLNSLNEPGVIVMHDCNPSHPAAAYPAASYQEAAALKLPGWTPVWNGDVWKTVCYLRSHRDDLRVFVLDCDFGLGVVTRGKPENRLDLTEDELQRMTYEDLAKDRTPLLNLKDESYLKDFLASL